VDYLSDNFFFSNDRAKGLLSRQPRHSLSEGIKEMISFYEKKDR